MIEAIALCSVYVAMLLVLSKYFGVKYTDITKNNETIKKGIIYPVGISTIVLVIYAYIFGWIPGVFLFKPVINEPILWSIPFVILVSIIARLTKIDKNAFQKKGLLLLGLATLLVGISEELLVRGLVVGILTESGYSILTIGIISSVIFGLLHFMNFFNGQDIGKTTVQVAGTIFMGINFYIIYIITGTLLAPIILHFLYDFSILGMGQNLKMNDKNITALLIVAMYILPIIALLFI